MNPDALEFHPQSFPYGTHQKTQPEPVSLSLPLSSYYTYNKKQLPPAPFPFYFYKLGVPCFFPTFQRRLSCYNTHSQPQPQPHSVIKPSVPVNHADGEAAAGGNGAKNFTARGRRSENYGRKAVISRKKVCGPVWVPKKTKLDHEAVEDSISFSPSSEGKSTVMIKNIPNEYRRHMLMEFLDKLCFEQNQKSDSESGLLTFEYDFLYLPMDFRTNNNLGYAFVNFTSAMAATRIGEILRGFRWGVFKDIEDRTIYPRKKCEITWATSQGKEKLVNRFRNSQFCCQDREYLPAVFSPPRDGANSAATSLSVVGSCFP